MLAWQPTGGYHIQARQTAGSAASGFAGNDLSESVHPNDLPPMGATGDKLMLVTRFDLESDRPPLDMDNAREARDRLSRWRWSEMFHFDLDPD